MTEQLTDQHLRDLLARVLELRPEDWGDVDMRVLFARVMRLQAQVHALQEHHSAVHPSCGHAGEHRQPARRDRQRAESPALAAATQRKERLAA